MILDSVNKRIIYAKLHGIKSLLFLLYIVKIFLIGYKYVLIIFGLLIIILTVSDEKQNYNYNYVIYLKSKNDIKIIKNTLKNKVEINASKNVLKIKIPDKYYLNDLIVLKKVKNSHFEKINYLIQKLTDHKFYVNLPYFKSDFPYKVFLSVSLKNNDSINLSKNRLIDGFKSYIIIIMFFGPLFWILLKVIPNIEILIKFMSKKYIKKYLKQLFVKTDQQICKKIRNFLVEVNKSK